MQLGQWLRRIAISLSCVGMLLPAQFVVAQEIATPQSEARIQPDAAVDVALAKDGSFVGVVVDAAGQPHSGLPVSIRQFNQNVAEIASNDVGEFRCQLQNGGMYLLAAGDQLVVLRCWADGTAPPHARSRLMVQASDVVRGQIHPAACGLANPWVITGIAVAAIVIPVALHNNRSDRDDGSE